MAEMTLTPELELERQNLQRRQRVAETLIAAGQRPIQGQMAGRFFVPPSWTQGVAQLANAHFGGKAMADVEKGQRDIGTRYNEGLAQAVKDYTASGTVPVDPQEIEQNADQGTPLPRPDPRARVAQALTSPYAPVRELGKMDFQREAKAEDREAALQDRLAVIEAQAREGRITRAAADRQAAEARRDLATHVASLRQPPQPRQPQIVQGPTGPMVLQPDGTAKPVMGADGKPVQGPKGGNKPLSATAQKELFEAEDSIEAANDVIGTLKRALEINNTAFEGGTANARAAAFNVLPGANSAGTNATIELNNLVGEKALQSLKAIFGGMPTEGERKILLEISGSANQPAKVRKAIFERATKAAERRIAVNKEKAQKLRDGTYFSEAPASQAGGAPPVIVDW